MKWFNFLTWVLIIMVVIMVYFKQFVMAIMVLVLISYRLLDKRITLLEELNKPKIDKIQKVK